MSPCHFCCRVSMTCVCGQPFDANDGAIGQDVLFDRVATIFISCKLGLSNLVTGVRLSLILFVQLRMVHLQSYDMFWH